MSTNKDQFLRVCGEFKLGNLSTESFHPKTHNLSSLAVNDLAKAIKSLQAVDLDALLNLESKLEEIYHLFLAVQKTLKSGHRIFLSGCGATGRLSLALETFWRSSKGTDQVIGFMAGGDYALIKSVESFEDQTSYGARQLEELGFEEGDLLLAVTEGGETSFVIGSAWRASELSSHKPFFIYCNPDQELFNIQRSKEVIESLAIRKLNLSVGPMAISGSTRMQATTVQMSAIALALSIEAQNKDEFILLASKELQKLKELSFSMLQGFIEKESAIYQNGGIITYVSDEACAITILTDTTERSPTFSLAPFEKTVEEHRCLAYLCLEGETDSEAAWEKLLRRPLRSLSWKELPLKIDKEETLLFDISERALERRDGEKHFRFKIAQEEKGFRFKLGDLEDVLPAPSEYEALNQVALKIALNILSTLVMGRIGRYEGNVMTYVRPSNFKLIDRAARYVIELGSREGSALDYDQVVEELFVQIPLLKMNEPVVLKTLKALAKTKA